MQASRQQQQSDITETEDETFGPLPLNKLEVNNY